jgi:hypothetical protein
MLFDRVGEVIEREAVDWVAQSGVDWDESQEFCLGWRIALLLSSITSPQEIVSHNSKWHSYQYMSALKPNAEKYRRATGRSPNSAMFSGSDQVK